MTANTQSSPTNDVPGPVVNPTIVLGLSSPLSQKVEDTGAVSASLSLPKQVSARVGTTAETAPSFTKTSAEAAAVVLAGYLLSVGAYSGLFHAGRPWLAANALFFTNAAVLVCWLALRGLKLLRRASR